MWNMSFISEDFKKFKSDIGNMKIKETAITWQKLSVNFRLCSYAYSSHIFWKNIYAIPPILRVEYLSKTASTPAPAWRLKKKKKSKSRAGLAFTYSHFGEFLKHFQSSIRFSPKLRININLSSVSAHINTSLWHMQWVLTIF